MKTAVSLAEIASALAVVVSLLYVGHEYSRSQTLTSREVEDIVYSRMLEMDRLIIETPDLAKLVLRASDDSDHLTPDERIRLLAYQHVFFDSWESIWYYHTEGILDDQAWASWNSWFVDEAQRRAAWVWEDNRHNYNGTFLTYVDGILSDRNK